MQCCLGNIWYQYCCCCWSLKYGGSAWMPHCFLLLRGNEHFMQNQPHDHLNQNVDAIDCFKQTHPLSYCPHWNLVPKLALDLKKTTFYATSFGLRYYILTSQNRYRFVPRVHDNFWIYRLVCLIVTKNWRMMSCLEFCHTEQVSREKGTVEAVLRSVRHPRTPSSPFFTSPLFSLQGENEAGQLSHTEDPRRDTWSK